MGLSSAKESIRVTIPQLHLGRELGTNREVLFMNIPLEALELENRFLGENQEATLAAAFDILLKHWDAGGRERETGLHLMFLSWFGIIEPQHITGFPEEPVAQRNLQQTFAKMHSQFESEINDDVELLFVFGLPAQMFWFMFDDAAVWEERAKVYRHRFRELAPNGIDPAVFKDRGAYGDYYESQAKVEGGF